MNCSAAAHEPYARAVAAAAPVADYTTAFNEIIKEDVQILVAPDLQHRECPLGPAANPGEQ